jgi:hypothetical protein
MLESSLSQEVICEIIDTKGKRIHKFTLQNGLTTLNVNYLEKGIYFIQLTGKAGNNVLKFVKN